MEIVPYLHKQKIRQWFFARYHADGAKCPGCGALLQNGTVAARNFWQMRRFVCPECHQRITARVGTPLAESHLAPEDLFVIEIAREIGLPPGETAKILRKPEATIRAMYSRLDAWWLMVDGGWQ